MKRIALLVLTAAAAVDVSQQAYNSDLASAIAQRRPDQSVLHVVAQSPVMPTLLHWALFLAAFGLLSLVMSARRPHGGPDVLG